MTADTERRIEKLRKIPLYRNEETYPNDQVTAVMEDALNAFLEYTHRAKDLGEAIDSIIIELCKSRINKTGLEGMGSVGEGGVSQSWEIEPWLKSRMFRYKLMQGIPTPKDRPPITWMEITGEPADAEALVLLIKSLIGEGGADMTELIERLVELERLILLERYIHEQEEPSEVWEVEHGLGRPVSAAVYDTNGEEIEGLVTLEDDVSLTIEFSHAHAGKAVIQ